MNTSSQTSNIGRGRETRKRDKEEEALGLSSERKKTTSLELETEEGVVVAALITKNYSGLYSSRFRRRVKPDTYLIPYPKGGGFRWGEKQETYTFWDPSI